MSYTKTLKSTGNPFARMAAALCMLFIAMVARPVRAEIQNASVNLRISESEKYLATGLMNSMFGYESMYFRNTPFIEIKNTSANAALAEFRMTIGDEAFHFGNQLFPDYVLLGSHAGSVPAGGLELETSVEDGGNELVVEFLDGGLAPNETVRFQIDINADDDPAMGAYDFRNVLFDRSGFQKYGTSAHGISSADNAAVTLTFFMAGMPPLTHGPFPFPDPESPAGPFTDGDMFAPYALSTSLDPPAAFELDTQPIVPEPSSVLLLIAGLAGLAIFSMSEVGRRRVACPAAVVPGTNSR